jgi:Fe-S cluster assembly protein SufD
MAATLDRGLAEAAESVGRSGDPEWLMRARREGFERFQALGFPTPRDEEWRFTSVAPIAEGGFVPAADGADRVGRAGLAPFAVPAELAATLVFVNGRVVPGLSQTDGLPAGVRVGSLASALADPRSGVGASCTRVAPFGERAFVALNTAFLADGAVIEIAARTVLDRPVHLLFLASGGTRPTMNVPRVLIVQGESSQLSVVETYGTIGSERCFTNAVTEIVAGENASLFHYKLDREGAGSYHVGGMFVHAARNAQVSSHVIGLGRGALVRNDIVVVLDGEGGLCTLNGLYLGDGTRLVDNHTTIDHARPHCASREVYKGVLADRARAVFNGKIIVRPDAQKTDAKQTNKALLLSDDAQINTKPQLEIFANDVRCTHGAAVGQMDEDALFYMRARGIDARHARHMLIQAFAADVLVHMPMTALREQIERELGRRLPEGSAR